MSDFGEGKWVKARKDCRCEWCGQAIKIGDRVYSYKGMWDGEWQNWRMHPECYEDHTINCDSDGFSPYEAARPSCAGRKESGMLLKMDDWKRIRDNFTEMEKKMLNESIQGETICPRGCIIAEDTSVAIKAKKLVAELERGKQGG